MHECILLDRRSMGTRFSRGDPGGERPSRMAFLAALLARWVQPLARIRGYTIESPSPIVMAFVVDYPRCFGLTTSTHLSLGYVRHFVFFGNATICHACQLLHRCQGF